MPSWEEEKRNAQMAFTAPESDREAAHASVDSFYSQILTRGYITPALSNASLNQQILDGDFKEPNVRESDVDRMYEQEQDQDCNWDVEQER